MAVINKFQGPREILEWPIGLIYRSHRRIPSEISAVLRGTASSQIQNIILKREKYLLFYQNL